MRCYYHHVRPAVGVCRACGRGVCEECAADLNRALACRGRCEEDATRLVGLVDSSIRQAESYRVAQKSAFQSQKTVCALAAVMGLLIAAWCVMLGPTFMIGAVLGVLLAVFGVFGTYRAARAERGAG